MIHFQLYDILDNHDSFPFNDTIHQNDSFTRTGTKKYSSDSYDFIVTKYMT